MDWDVLVVAEMKNGEVERWQVIDVIKVIVIKIEYL